MKEMGEKGNGNSIPEVSPEIAELVVKCSICGGEGFAADTITEGGNTILKFRNLPVPLNSSENPQVICNFCAAKKAEELRRTFPEWFRKYKFLPALIKTLSLRAEEEKARKEAEERTDRFIKENNIKPDPEAECAFCGAKGHGRKMLARGSNGKPFCKVDRFSVIGKPESLNELKDNTCCSKCREDAIAEATGFIHFLTYEEALEEIERQRQDSDRRSRLAAKVNMAKEREPHSQVRTRTMAKFSPKASRRGGDSRATGTDGHNGR